MAIDIHRYADLTMAHITKEHGESYAPDLMGMLGISVQLERDASESSSEVFDCAYNQLTDTLMQSLHSDEEGADPETWQAIEEVALEQKMNMPYLLTY